jgi:hypothetical protein
MAHPDLGAGKAFGADGPGRGLDTAFPGRDLSSHPLATCGSKVKLNPDSTRTMNTLEDSTTRGFLDYCSFALVFLGFVVVAAGVVMTSPGVAFFGALLAALSLAYFLIRR